MREPFDIAVYFRCSHMRIRAVRDEREAESTRRHCATLICEDCEAIRLEEERRNKKPHWWSRRRRHQNIRIERFEINQQEKTTMNTQSSGNTITLTASPVPAGAVPATGNPVTWTSSDPTNAPVVVDQDDETGLTASITFPEEAVVGTTFSVTCSYTNADDTVATGSFSGSIVEFTEPVTDITSFTIEQTA